MKLSTLRFVVTRRSQSPRRNALSWSLVLDLSCRFKWNRSNKADKTFLGGRGNGAHALLLVEEELNPDRWNASTWMGKRWTMITVTSEPNHRIRIFVIRSHVLLGTLEAGVSVTSPVMEECPRGWWGVRTTWARPCLTPGVTPTLGLWTPGAATLTHATHSAGADICGKLENGPRWWNTGWSKVLGFRDVASVSLF